MLLALLDVTYSDDLRLHIHFLIRHLKIAHLCPRFVFQVIALFFLYVQDFLQYNTHVLDPQLAQVKLRVRLAFKYQQASWGWDRQFCYDPENIYPTLQDDCAAEFVIGVIHLFSTMGKGITVTEEGEQGDFEELVQEIHRWLCVLQSVWLNNGVWIEVPWFEDRMHRALYLAFKELEPLYDKLSFIRRYGPV